MITILHTQQVKRFWQIWAIKSKFGILVLINSCLVMRSLKPLGAFISLSAIIYNCIRTVLESWTVGKGGGLGEPWSEVFRNPMNDI